MGGVFAKNTSLETNFFVSRLVFFTNIPPKHDTSVQNALCCIYTINSVKSFMGLEVRGLLKASCSCCGWLYFSPLLLSFLFSIIIYVLSRSSIKFHYPVTELQISCVFAFFTLWKRVKTHVLSDQCTHYAYILLCQQTFQIRSVLVQSCT